MQNLLEGKVRVPESERAMIRTSQEYRDRHNEAANKMRMSQAEFHGYLLRLYEQVIAQN